MSDEPLTAEERDWMLCWQCLRSADDAIHDEKSHVDCSADCLHHSFEHGPDSRTALLNHVGALLSAINNKESELQRLAGPVCEHDGKRAVEHTHRNGYCRAPNGDYRHANCAEHPPTPSIEKWLRERSDQ